MIKPLTAFDQNPKVARRIRQERCRYLREQNVPLDQIAKEVGFSRKYVSSLTADLTDRKRRIDVPAWVPAPLRNLYVQIGQRDGEHEAASQCRKMKAALAQGITIDQGALSLWSAR